MNDNARLVKATKVQRGGAGSGIPSRAAQCDSSTASATIELGCPRAGEFPFASGKAPASAGSAVSKPAAKRSNSAIVRGIWAGAGLVLFALGVAGVALPILPTTPFILLAAICFARSSERLDNWFKGTKVYKMVFENYMEKRPMSVKKKLSILFPVTVLLGIGFFLTGNVPVARVVVAMVWMGHVIYFGFIVKTARA